jgi:hypothetical protein
VIHRALIQVAGRSSSGKTLLIEQLLRSFDDSILVARCVPEESSRAFRESAPKAHPELRRYRRAGAGGVALFTCPASGIDSEDLYSTELMQDYSVAVVLEGDCGSLPVDIRVQVVPTLAPGASLLERRWQDHAAERRAQLDEMERILGGPDGVVKVFGPIVGEPAMTVFAKSAGQLERLRADLQKTFARMRTGPPPKPTRRWTIASGYEGIERAQVVVVNIRREQERPHADRLIAEVARIRRDPEVFDQILGWRGRKTPITAVAANLGDASEAGTKKALARLRRGIRQPQE